MFVFRGSLGTSNKDRIRNKEIKQLMWVDKSLPTETEWKQYDIDTFRECQVQGF